MSRLYKEMYVSSNKVLRFSVNIFNHAETREPLGTAQVCFGSTNNLQINILSLIKTEGTHCFFKLIVRLLD